MERLMIVSHGEKGGVGKSTVATLLTELAPSRPMLVECDESAPDVARRYRAYGYQGVSIPLLTADSAADALSDLMSEIEACDADVVLVNLPAAASAVVDAYAQEIISVAQQVRRKLVVTYAIGSSYDSAAAARKCAETGLASVADVRLAVLNTYFGPAHRLGWDDDCRAVWDGPETVLPALADRVTARIRSIEAPLSRIADGDMGDVPLVDRALLRRWMRECQPLADAVYG
ncbi:MAG: hypothetical protein H7A19_18685 [Rhodanobacteraceae bacterium]|nr:hypothetical protein [Rhodanobacteraceae bacterium]